MTISTTEKIDDLGTAFAVAVLRIANGALRLINTALLRVSR